MAVEVRDLRLTVRRHGPTHIQYFHADKNSQLVEICKRFRRDFRLPPQSGRELRSSGLLRIEWF